MKTLFVIVLILVAVNQGIQLFSKPKEVVRQVEVIRQVPVEVVRYVEVPKIVEVEKVVEKIVEVPKIVEVTKVVEVYPETRSTRITNLRDHSYEARRRR